MNLKHPAVGGGRSPKGKPLVCTYGNSQSQLFGLIVTWFWDVQSLEEGTWVQFQGSENTHFQAWLRAGVYNNADYNYWHGGRGIERKEGLGKGPGI